ncbi:MAG TPA: OB-fold nucleic acid binding domain-containing protein, partial [Acidimicrobiales bacterium]
GFAAGWQRVLHDATADQIAAAVAQLPHVNATMVPYQLTGGWFSRRRQWRRNPDGSATTARGARAADRAADREAAVKASFDRSAFGEQRRGTTPIDEAQWRHRVRVAGRVKSVRVQPRAGTSNLECMLVDDTGKLLLVFQGRRRIPGIQPGARLVVEGMVGDWARRQAILNPDYELIAGPEAAVEPT